MAPRNTAASNATDSSDDLVDDTIVDEQPMDAFDDEFDAAASSALSDDTPADDPADDVIEGDTALLDDEGSEAEAGDAGQAPAKGVDRGDGRDATGKFATKAEQDAADAKAAKAAKEATDATTAGKPAADAAAQSATTTAAADTQPKWEPLQVNADKKVVPIEEVTVTRQNGFHLMAVKDADFPRFAQRMSKGIVGERLWRDLQSGLKELEAERAAPQPKSDDQIEAEIVLATIKSRLGELLEPHELENLEMRVKLAQRDYKDTYATERKTWFDARAEQERAAVEPEVEQRTQLEGIANEMLTVFERHKDKLGELTEPQLRAAYDNLVRVRRAVYWKEADGWYTNTELIYEQLAAAKAGSAARTTEAPPATAGHTATTDATPKPDAAERFNRAGNTAARPAGSAAPQTTSLKANRGQARPRDARHTRDTTDGQSKRPAKTPAMIAEDQWRQKRNKFMSSDSLDIPDEDDDS